MLAAAGFRWVRMDFVWQSTETAKGTYDFTEYVRLLKALDAHQLKALFILEPIHCTTAKAGIFQLLDAQGRLHQGAWRGTVNTA